MFNDLHNNKSLHHLAPAILTDGIDWGLTKSWIGFNPTNHPTSTHLGKYYNYKIKSSTFGLPTGKEKKRNFPLLYTQNLINCPQCNVAEDNNAHLGTCSVHILELADVFQAHKHKLIQILTDNNNTSHKVDIERNVNQLQMFQWANNPSNQLTPNHPVYLLSHNLILTELSEISEIINMTVRHKKKLIITSNNFLFGGRLKPYSIT